MLDEAQAREKIRAIFRDPDVIRVWDALASANPEPLRLVGGTIRDLLLERDASEDLDFATPLRPDEVKDLIGKQNWNDVEILTHGESHGTIMLAFKSGAEIDLRSFEITTLREDTETDGRHAKVKYAHNWEEGCKLDSNRRDFTINAIYGDNEGEYKRSTIFTEGRKILRKNEFVSSAHQ